MKRIITITVIAICTICQIKAIDFRDDHGITASAFFGCSHYQIKIPYTGGYWKNDFYHPVITPRLGYRFNSAWEAGLLYRYERQTYENEHYSGIGAYGEWSFLRFLRGFRLIAEAHILHCVFKGNKENGWYGKNNMTEVGMMPCIAYNIPGSPVDIKLRYLFLGLNNSHSRYKGRAPGCLGRGDWIVDASLRRLEIGASITF